MTTVEARVLPQAKRTKSATSAKSAKPRTTKRPASKHTVASDANSRDETNAARVTKSDRLLTLLGRRDGATITEMMEATGWQQHSVRGFLAGTVKKKLALALTSSKTTGELRRYRIDAKRGR